MPALMQRSESGKFTWPQRVPDRMMGSRATSRLRRTVLVRVGAIMARRRATAIRFGLRRNTSTRHVHFRLFCPLISVAGILGRSWLIGRRASLRLCLRAFRGRENVVQRAALRSGSFFACGRAGGRRKARLHRRAFACTVFGSYGLLLKSGGKTAALHIRRRLGGLLRWLGRGLARPRVATCCVCVPGRRL